MARETAKVVEKALFQDIIPRFGLPQSVQSDNGLAFIAQIIQQESRGLQITWHLYIPCHPQSSGKMEKVNGLIKMHLTKLILELHQCWPELLPLALTRLRTPSLGPYLPMPP